MALSAELFFRGNGCTGQQRYIFAEKSDEGHTIDDQHNMSFNHSNIALFIVPISRGWPKGEEVQLNKHWN